MAELTIDKDCKAIPATVHGPWEHEPDRVEFVEQGLRCVVWRRDHGALCGYVVIPQEHKLFGVHYNEEPMLSMRVHGGVTLTEWWPEVSQTGWIVGFDCAHGGDLVPAFCDMKQRAVNQMGKPLFPINETYRNLSFACIETKRLAAQIADANDA